MVEDALGVPMQEGGRHPLMGTHNRLLSLGPDAYLEVIAVDPDAERPDRARWFGLDRAPASPRLSYWAARVDDLDGALAAAPPGMGAPVALSRGALSWRMAIPPSGDWPFDGALPALLEWQGAGPAGALTDRGCRLSGLSVTHPRMGQIAALWPALGEIPSVSAEIGPQPRLIATISTPDGPRRLVG